MPEASHFNAETSRELGKSEHGLCSSTEGPWIAGFQCRLNLTDSLISLYLLHPPGWFWRLRRDLSLPHITSVTNEALFLNY